MRNWFSSGRALGVDVGTVSMKLVELAREKGGISMTNYGMLETQEYFDRPNGSIQTSSLKISERDAIPLLKTLVREAKPKTKRAFASVPAFAAFFAPLEMPALSPAETAKSVAFQARRYIPLPPDQVTIDWAVVGSGENERGQAFQRVLLTGVPKSIIASYQRIFKAAGLSLAGLEVQTQALARAAAFGLPAGEPKSTLLIDIGGLATDVMVVVNGAVNEVGQSDYGGFALTQAIARSLMISPRRAEDLKRRRGISGTAGERELSTSLYPFIDVILQECRRVRMAYERRSGSQIAQCSVVGGGGNLQGIEAYVSAQLGLPHAALSMLGSKVRTPPGLEPVARELNREFATAFGLAIRLIS